MMLGFLLPLGSLVAGQNPVWPFHAPSLARVNTPTPAQPVADRSSSGLPYTGRDATPASAAGAAASARGAQPTAVAPQHAAVADSRDELRSLRLLDRPTATPRPATPTPTPEATPTPEPTPPGAADGPPTQIIAEAIGLDATVVPVGWRHVQQGSQLVSVWNVAEYAAGWHQNSAVPGQGGNIVIAGHSDIRGEVFKNLEHLAVGDTVRLLVGDRAFEYVVEEVHTVQEKGASAETRRENARFIGSFPEERLTLITCWPYGVASHRRIVIARPKHS